MKKLAIIGSGDLGQLIAHHCKNDHAFDVIGFYDDWKAKGTFTENGKVLGTVDELINDFKNKVFDEVLIAVGYKHFQGKKKLFDHLIEKEIPMGTFIHSSCYVDSSCQIGKGCILLPRCTLDMGVILEENILLNTGCTIAHDTNVGKHSFLAPANQLAGFIKTGECCFLGIGTTIIDNIQLTDFVQTGAGTVVTKNLMEPGLYVGVPARKINK